VTRQGLSPAEIELLVRRSRSGDVSAFSELVEAHQALVFGTALRLVRDREEAAEVSNRTFFKAYRSLADYDPNRPFRPWLLRIAANEALNALRGRTRQAAHAVTGEAAEIELEQAPGGPDPAEVAPRHEQTDAVRAAVERLPDSMRLVTVLRYFDDLSYAEIAEVTGQTVNAVGVTLLRARDRLRHELTTRGVTADALS
jgi:RNA polymerase sigma-70 factor, ECF subfamily